MKEYAVIVDLGKKHDRAVFFVMKHVQQIVDGDPRRRKPDRLQHFYDIPFIDQFARVPYPALVDRLCVLTRHVELSRNAHLLVDGRSVGEAVVDMMRGKGLYPIPIVAGSGAQVHPVYADMGEVFPQVKGKLRAMKTLLQINVPKEDLVDAGLVLAQEGRVGVARTLRWAEDFKRELENFKEIENKRTHHLSYEAEDPEVLDDMVVCYLMGAWWFTRGGEAVMPPDRVLSSGSGQRTVDWQPSDFL